jgi:hypothetical protein
MKISPGRRAALKALTLFGLLALFPIGVMAQDEAALPPPPDSTRTGQAESYANLYFGQFTPGSGFDIIHTERGSLNISFYGLFRYLNQLPGEQTFTDHLGRTRTVKARNDINWHRSFVWLSGFFIDPKFRYTMAIWSLPTTQQTLVFGVLRYTVSLPLTIGCGIGPNLTCRSVQGSWPFWAGSDRQMTEDGLRGGFSSSFFITGSPIDRFYYTAAVNTNLSQLGVTATNDSRDFAYSASVWWMPTTNEFGPRGGFGDLENHEQPATRFGVSACTSHESRYASTELPPNATQIRLSDGVYPFEAGALIDTVTVERLQYQDFSVDAGAKYRGFSLQAEYTIRTLSDFQALDPSGKRVDLSLDSILDQAFFVEAMHMVVPKKLGLYAATSYMFDDFERNPWEAGGGASFYPYGNRSWRINLHIMHVDKSPAGSTFGYYTAGQTGTILSIGTDILL